MKKIQKFLKAACAAMMMFGDVFTNLQTVLAAPLHGERVISGSLGVWTLGSQSVAELVMVVV